MILSLDKSFKRSLKRLIRKQPQLQDKVSEVLFMGIFPRLSNLVDRLVFHLGQNKIWQYRGII
jgi:mRNA-degrading endonuclease YafQ of YafQ-DinJ toxin-antitoxin module